ncbi:MAG: hypothetical protein AAF483_10035 [Planctomycetota bacterium]
MAAKRAKERTIEALMARRMISFRDLDAISVANGYFSYEAIDDFLEGSSSEHNSPDYMPASQDAPAIAKEIVERICSCQFHDGGGTSLKSASDQEIELEFHGACKHCPQIRYTADILKMALQHRMGRLDTVRFFGVALDEESTLPVNNQFTLSRFCREYGLTLKEIDEALERFGRLTDRELQLLGLRARMRRENR